MPTYDYLCQACGHKFEEFQSIKAQPLKKCPKCGKLHLQRLIGTGAGIIFKGSGFYQTDYPSESYTRSAKSDTGSSSSHSSTSAAKTESKPEVKTETKTETKTDTKPVKSETKKKSA
jgi:putative FmdB family regulatory protein